MRTSLVTAVLATVVVLGTAGAAPGSPPGDRTDRGTAPSACGAGSSAAHCSGIFDLTSDRAMRERLAAR